MDETALWRVRRAAERHEVRVDGVTTRHAFSFGAYYDPAWISFGALVAHNDETLMPGGGFDPHPHHGVDIVTWVVAGSLEHRDSISGAHRLGPGTLQVLSAGDGVRHSERHTATATATAPVPVCRFIQMWVSPVDEGGEPSYRQAAWDEDALASGLVVVASGMPEHRGRGAVEITQPGAVLHVARLAVGELAVLPSADRVHLFVAVGRVEAEGVGTLYEGDSLLAQAAPARGVRAHEPSEILVWQLAG